MPEGGKLLITARNADDHVVVTVSDRDRDPQLPYRIFDPFFTTKGPGDGTGWVFTSHNIITKAGGTIVTRGRWHHVHGEPFVSQ